jgi:hypothetical protein
MDDLMQVEIDHLETMINRCGLTAVVEALSTICGLKAEHVAHTWQDAVLAKRWATAEGRLGVASTKLQGL